MEVNKNRKKKFKKIKRRLRTIIQAEDTRCVEFGRQSSCQKRVEIMTMITPMPVTTGASVGGLTKFGPEPSELIPRGINESGVPGGIFSIIAWWSGSE